MSRVSVTEVLKQLCVNVAQVYPDVIETYPLIIYKLEQVGKVSHDNVEYFNQSLSVEIYAETSEERSRLEVEVVRELFKNGWINYAGIDVSNEIHYRQLLNFERNE